MARIFKELFSCNKESSSKSHTRENQTTVKYSECVSYKVVSPTGETKEMKAERVLDMGRVRNSEFEQKSDTTLQPNGAGIQTVNSHRNSNLLQLPNKQSASNSSEGCHSAPLTTKLSPSLHDTPSSSSKPVRPGFTRDDSLMDVPLMNQNFFGKNGFAMDDSFMGMPLGINQNLFNGNGFIDTGRLIENTVPGMSELMGQVGICGSSWDI